MSESLAVNMAANVKQCLLANVKLEMTPLLAALQAQVHAPFADLTPIPRFLDALGEELRRRMADEGVSGGLPAVRMLSQFLFGRPAPGTPANGATLSLSALSGSTLEAALKLPAPGYGMGLQVPPSCLALHQ